MEALSRCPMVEDGRESEPMLMTLMFHDEDSIIKEERVRGASDM